MALGFGTSGVRGLVSEMTDLECGLYTRAFLAYARRKGGDASAVSLAGDFRSSTPRILRAVAHAARFEGLAVAACGRVPTPALVYHAMQRGQASIMITGSHIPDDRNGIKFNLPWGEVLKTDEPEISRLYRALKDATAADPREREFRAGFDAAGALLQSGPDAAPGDGEPEAPAAAAATCLAEYRQRYLDFFPAGALRGLRVVVFEHSSVARDLLAELLTALGAEVVRVGRSERFVPVDTEAVENPRQLADWVRAHAAAALVTADGDGDRPLLVDERGELVRGDVLGILVARYLDADAVAAPVSCNTALERAGCFGHVARTRIGSPYVIAAMEEARAAGHRRVMGYEANGGFLLASDLSCPAGGAFRALPTRDAALPLLAGLHDAARRGLTLSELVATLPARFTASGLLRDFPVEKSRAVMALLQEGGAAAAEKYFAGRFGPVATLDFTDGARVTFAGGDIVHLRPSGNAPEFRCYTEADTPATAAAANRDALGLLRERILPALG